MKRNQSSAVRVKRVYEEPDPDDGFRVLVDRIWPRGLRKEDAAVDLWLKDVAPSTALRQWFGHDPKKWAEFKRRYHAELAQDRAALEPLESAMRKGKVTLLYGAHDTEHNNAVALAAFLAKS